jgi:cytochrome c peroxidase
MPASSLSLRLTTTAFGSTRAAARLFLAVVGLCALEPSVAQAPPQWGRGQEPITPIPPAPIQDPRQVAFGDRLFHDPRLSHDNTLSCNSCHDTATNGTEAGRPKPPELNTPTVFNAALNWRLNWEGDLRTLESQVEQALRNPRRMGSSLNEALNKLRADPELSRQFREVYGREMDDAGILAAISTYERSLLTLGCRFDLWLDGDASALTPEELAGYRLFKSLGCVSCHQGVNVGGNMYQRHAYFIRSRLPSPRSFESRACAMSRSRRPIFTTAARARCPRR